MKILVAIHTLELGGSQINAIELAEKVTSLSGHQVEIYAPEGVLSQRVRDSGFTFHVAPGGDRVPSLSYIFKLNKIVRDGSFDLIHCYEWHTTINSMLGPGWTRGTPVLSTIYSMDVPYLIPPTVPMIVGTRFLQRTEAQHREYVALIEPPVDISLYAPGIVHSSTRRDWSVSEEDLLLVVVCRLANRLKLEGLLAAIRAVGRLDKDYPIRLLIVGSGPSHHEVEGLVNEVNADCGHEVVTLVGEISDPREFYDSADIAIGMGASALRSMAFSKPLLVQGEGGFWQTLNSASLGYFMENGFYGLGDGSDGTARCESELKYLLGLSAIEREGLGIFGRSVIEKTFSLEAATSSLVDLYLKVAAQRVPRATRIRRIAMEIVVLVKHRLAIARHRLFKSAST